MSLDCWYCGMEFGDFAPLAFHVQRVHFKRLNYGKGGIWDMNVGQYNQSGGDRLPLIDSAMFKRLQKNGKVTGKILAVRQITAPKFKGLALDFKNGTEKFGFLTAFDRFDIGAIIAQLGSEETDDWIGQNLRFVTKKAKTGNKVFVNVEFPKKKRS